MFSMNNILIKFKFQLSRAKVSVKVAVLRTHIAQKESRFPVGRVLSRCNNVKE